MAAETIDGAAQAPAKTVGQFHYYEDGSISGPESYMLEQGLERLRRFNAGEISMVVRTGYEMHGDMILALMVDLQTDYAAWMGMRAMFGAAR